MSLEKVGASEKILEVAKNTKEFEKLRENIAKDNNLVKCSRCEKLIAKRGSSGEVDIKHQNLIVVTNTPSVIVCTKCGQQNTIEK
jgi:hypothetical protein